MNKLFDLRFVIGLFFTVIGLLVAGYGFMANDPAAQTVDRYCGIVFLAFGIFMILLSLRKVKS